MTELNNLWRQKYRRSLVEQERLDGTIEAQKTMLLRAYLICLILPMAEMSA